MTSDQIRNVVRSQPFRPFVLKTTGGREYMVNHPELAVLSPGGRTLVVFDSSDAASILDVLMIESIHPLPENGSQQKRSA